MKIAFSRFRSAIRSRDFNDGVYLIELMKEKYHLSKYEAVEKYNRISKAKLPNAVQLAACTWGSYILPQSECLKSHKGDWVSKHYATEYGRHCVECKQLFHRNEIETIHPYVNASNKNGYICISCVASTEAIFDDIKTYYHKKAKMPAQLDWDNLLYPSRDHLINSYQISNALAKVPTTVTEKVHHWMLNYTANPLDYRESFLYEEAEKLPLIPLWLGVELEVIPNDKATSAPGFFHKVASALRKFAIIKSDGSLDHGGFEICTVPATLVAHKSLWLPFFQNAAPLLKSWYNGKYGMHVHMNKAFFTASEIGKALIFVNSAGNKEFIEKVAGRYASTFTQYTPKKFGDAKRPATGHYDALSVSGHTGKTLELRIFRGNVSKEGFFKNIEFTDALGHFVKDTSARELSSHDFMKWISQPAQRARYPYFIAWASKTNLLKTMVDKKLVDMPKFSVGKSKEELTFETA